MSSPERQTLSFTHKDDSEDAREAVRTEPSIYLVVEGERPLAGGLRASLAGIDEVVFARGRARAVSTEGRRLTVEVPDPRMSSRHARLVREGRGFYLEDTGSTNGTFLAGAPALVRMFERTPTVAGENTLAFVLGATAFFFVPDEVAPEGTASVIDAARRTSRPRGMATLVPAIETSMPQLLRVAASALPILLLGPTGSGKEVLARTIHEMSGRTGPFVAINCGALAPTLIESTLFGHARGAFSGALRDEPGLVRAAHGGTLFLDEIGELPPPAQAALLRVLQEKEVLPVGATKPVAVDLRVVSATLQPIDGPSATFRPDLYARVAGFVHRVPSLRERRGDLGLLIADLLPRVDPERADMIRLAPDLAGALVAHEWPHNIRELEHVLSVASVTAPLPQLRLEHTGESLRSKRVSAPPVLTGSAQPTQPQSSQQSRDGGGGEADDDPARPLSEAEQRTKEDLIRALTDAGGNVSEVSRAMGRTRMQIHRWAKRFGVDLESFRKR